MKTLTLEKPGQFVQSETQAPSQPGEGEALVSVKRVGICGTDLHAYRGRQPFFSYPRILGHELGVEILEIGSGVTKVKVGDRCAVEPYLNCGICLPCKKGKTNCCTNLKVLGVHLDGGMRESIIVPANKLHVSNSLETEQLALVETLGIGCHAVDRAQLEDDENVLVIGAGPIGLSVVQFLNLQNVNVYVLEIDQGRRTFCKNNFNVVEAIDPQDSPIEKLQSLLNGELPTAVFDATGNPQSMQTSFEFVSSTGKLIFVGLFQGDVSFNDPEFHRREMTLLSSRNSTSRDFKRIIAHMEKGEIDVNPWITDRTSLENLPETFPAWLDPENGTVKAMLEFS